MTSEIRTNSLKSRAGLSTVTLTDSGPIFSGITTFLDNSIFNVGNINATGVVTATSFVGSGANLTGISAGTSLSGSTNNTVCTVTGANAIQGEANLTYDGTSLDVNASATAASSEANTLVLGHGSGNYVGMTLQCAPSYPGSIFFTDTDSGNQGQIVYNHSQNELRFYANAQQKLTCGSAGVTINNGSLFVDDSIIHNNDTNTKIRFPDADTITAETGGNERLRIDSSGRVLIGTTTEGVGGADELTINTASGHGGMTIRNDTSSNGNIFFSDGTSGAAEYAGYVQYAHNGNHMVFGTNGGERLRIDSSGNIKVGETNSGAVRLSITQSTNGGLMISKGSGTTPTNGQTIGDIGFSSYSDSQTNSSSEALIRAQASGNHSGSSAPTELLFFTKPPETGPGSAPSERLRIHKYGQVTIGHTSPSEPTTNGILLAPNGTSGFYSAGTPTLKLGRGSSDGTIIQFNRSGINCGYISVTTSSTSYSSGSDYRLKENVSAISDGITRLKTLKPSRFNFKVDKDVRVDGFLAHEVTAVPESITGTKDEVDEDNNPVYQGIDQSKLVPLLTAALQEAITKIEKLEEDNIALRARVTNLEGN